MKLIKLFKGEDWEIELCIKHNRTKVFREFLELYNSKITVVQGLKKTDNLYYLSFKNSDSFFDYLGMMPDTIVFKLNIRNRQYNLLEGENSVLKDFIVNKDNALEYLLDIEAIKDELYLVFEENYSFIKDNGKSWFKNYIRKLKIDYSQSEFEDIDATIIDDFDIKVEDIESVLDRFIDEYYYHSTILPQIHEKKLNIIRDLNIHEDSCRSRVKFQQRLDHLLGLNKFFLLNLHKDNSEKYNNRTISDLFQLFEQNHQVYLAHYDVYGSAVVLINLSMLTIILDILKCINFVTITTVNLRYSQENNYLYYSNTKRNLPYYFGIKEELKFPEGIDYYCSFWYRAMVLGKLFNDLEKALKLTNKPKDITNVYNFIISFTIPEGMNFEINLSFRFLLLKKLLSNFEFDKVLILRKYFNVEYSFANKLLDYWENMYKTENISSKILYELYEKTSMELRFEIGNLWEAFCFKYLKERFNMISSDINNETTLVTKNRPDFIIGELDRNNKGLVNKGDVFWDAKKSLNAINDEIKHYLPYCNKLIFIILDNFQKPINVNNKIQYLFAKDIEKSIYSDSKFLIDEFEDVKYLSSNFDHIVEYRLNTAVRLINENNSNFKV